MTDPERTVPEGLIEAPFRVENAVARLGGALWLYLSLVLRRNRLGLVCRTLPSVAHDLGVTEEVLASWLARLVDTGLVEVEHPAPYLVLKLRFWSGSVPESPESSSALTRALARRAAAAGAAA